MKRYECTFCEKISGKNLTPKTKGIFNERYVPVSYFKCPDCERIYCFNCLFRMKSTNDALTEENTRGICPKCKAEMVEIYVGSKSSLHQ